MNRDLWQFKMNQAIHEKMRRIAKKNEISAYKTQRTQVRIPSTGTKPEPVKS